MKETVLEVFVDTADATKIKVRKPDGTIVTLASGGLDIPGVCTLEQFGAVGDGTTDDSAAMTAAMTALGTSSYSALMLGAKIYNVGAAAPYTPPAGKAIEGQGAGASILKTTANTDLLLISNEDGALRDFTILGNSTGGSQTGIRSGSTGGVGSGVSRLLIDNVSLKNLGANGFEYNQNPLAGGSSTYMGPALTNVIADGCATGFRLGERGEYVTFVNCHAQRCTGYGAVLGAGNYGLIACSFSTNHDGIDIPSSTNGAHGSIVGCKFNHNTTNQVRYSAGYGQQLVGCQIYGPQINVTTLSSGFELIGCEIDLGAWVVGSGATLRVADCVHDNIYGNDVTGVDVGATVIIQNCRRLDGSTPAWWLPWLQKNYTFGSDANQTLTRQQSYGSTLIIQSGVISTTRKITSARTPQAGGAPQGIVNNNANPVQFAWASGVHVTIAAGEWAIVGSDGTDAIKLQWGDASGGGGGGSPPAGTGIATVVGGAWDTTVPYGAAGTYLRSNGGGVSSFSNISASEIFSIPGSSGDLIINTGGAFAATSTIPYTKIGSVPGSNKQVFFNDSGAWGAHSGFQYDKATGAVVAALFEYSATKVIANSDGSSCFIGGDSSFTNQHATLRMYASTNTYLGVGSATYIGLSGGSVQINAGASGMAFYSYNTDTTICAPGASAGLNFTATQAQFGVPVGGHSGGNPFIWDRANVALSGGGPTNLSNAAQRCPVITFSGTPTGGHQVKFLEDTGAMWLVRNDTTVSIVLRPYGSGLTVTLPRGQHVILVCTGGVDLEAWAALF